MSHRIETVPVTDLLLDEANARLVDEQKSQSAALLAIAQEQGENLINLAEDIVEEGMLNPLEIPGVVAVDGEGAPYLVLEGNRRFAALKALESPEQVKGVYSRASQKRLEQLHDRFVADPIEEITCVIFDTAEELNHWIDLRHTGANKGVGLVTWIPGQQDRYRARHGGAPTAPRTQVEDFIARVGKLSDEALSSNRRVTTTLQRVINNKAARAILGIVIEGNEVRSLYPREEVAKGLSRLMDDLKRGEEDSRTLHSADDIRDYVARFKKADRPNPKTKLPKTVPLAELAAGVEPKAAQKGAKGKGRSGQSRERKMVAPKKLKLRIGEKRIGKIFGELTSLRAEVFPNAGGVLFRVFLELSCDHYVHANTIGTWSDSLAKKMKATAEHLMQAGKIEKAVKDMVAKNADSERFFAAAAVTFHQYVHNRKTSPKPQDLIDGWDELEPFFVALWP